MRLEPAAPRSRVKHSTTEPLCVIKVTCLNFFVIFLNLLDILMLYTPSQCMGESFQDIPEFRILRTIESQPENAEDNSFSALVYL